MVNFSGIGSFSPFQFILSIAINFFLIHLVAHYIGRKRRIGYMKSVAWCLVLSVCIGILVVLSSAKLSPDELAEKEEGGKETEEESTESI